MSIMTEQEISDALNDINTTPEVLLNCANSTSDETLLAKIVQHGNANYLAWAVLAAKTTSMVPNIQLGDKLVGTGSVGSSSQGYTVSLSANGNTLVLGGPNDDSDKGAVWVFTRTNGVWS